VRTSTAGHLQPVGLYLIRAFEAASRFAHCIAPNKWRKEVRRECKFGQYDVGGSLQRRHSVLAACGSLNISGETLLDRPFDLIERLCTMAFEK